MRLPREQFTVRRMMVAVAVVALLIAGIVMLEKHRRHARRDAEIQRALLQSLRPPAWWPPEWREELAASMTVDGTVSVAGEPVGAGTVSFILDQGGRVFSGKIDKGRYSLKQGRMPTGRYRIEVRSADGPEPKTTRGKGEMPMDQGSHRINLAF